MSMTTKIAEVPAAGGGSTCSVCGASIERDPKGETNRTWHHNDGDKHDHEAKPSGGDKESARTAKWQVKRDGGIYFQADTEQEARAWMQEQRDNRRYNMDSPSWSVEEKDFSKDSARKVAGSLNDLMEFDHPVVSDGNGNVTDAPSGIYAPEVYVDLDESGQMTSLDPSDISISPPWTLLNGFSGQQGYPGPIMHDSEFIGGGLESYIRENPGVYVAVVVTGLGGDENDDDNDVGWAIAYQPGVGSTSTRKGAPFADYKDFAACVAANQDKDDPEAYCGKIKHQVEDKKSSKTAQETVCGACLEPITLDPATGEWLDDNGDPTCEIFHSWCPACQSGELHRHSPQVNQAARKRAVIDNDGVNVCESCLDGDHDECTGADNDGVECMCIDMDHDDDPNRYNANDWAHAGAQTFQQREADLARLTARQVEAMVTSEMRRMTTAVREGKTATLKQAVKCKMDSGSMYGNVPMCDREAKYIVTYHNGTYGPFSTPVCEEHLNAVRGAAYPGVDSVEPISAAARRQAVEAKTCESCNKPMSPNAERCPHCRAVQPEREWKGSARTARSLSEIAAEIRRDWRPPNYAAAPYIEAMASLDSMSDNYGAESAKGIVAYFLSNASQWRGETAKRIRAELKSMQKGGARQAQRRTASNYYLDMIEDSNGDLVDIEYYHRFCAPQELKDKGEWPAPEFPDYDVYCAGCGELINEGIGNEAIRHQADESHAVEEDHEQGAVVRDPRNPRGLYGGDRNILLQDRALQLADEQKREQLELRQLEQTGARSDYAHWNEDQDYMWWQEEGRHGSEEPEYDDNPYEGPEPEEPEEGQEAVCEECGEDIIVNADQEWVNDAGSAICPSSTNAAGYHVPGEGGYYGDGGGAAERRQMGYESSRRPFVREGDMIAHPDADGGAYDRDSGMLIQENWENLVDGGMSPEDATERLHTLPGDDDGRTAGWVHDLLNFGNPDKWGEVKWEEGESIEDAPTIEQWRKDHGKDARTRTAMPAPSELGVKVGDIFYCSWGYDQTNVNFYEVIRLTGQGVEVQPIASRAVEGERGGNRVVAMPGVVRDWDVLIDTERGGKQSKVCRLKSGYQGRPTIVLKPGQYWAYLWDGQSMHETDYMSGH
jgi:hypothetical protein